MLKKNDEIQLTVKNCTLEGSGVCDYNGFTVFVRGAVTEDIIIAHIIKVKKTYAVGIIKKFIKKSPNRVISSCPVSDKCGGCSFAHLKYESELSIKAEQVKNNLRRIGKTDIIPQAIVPSPQITRYRNKAQYPVSSDGTFAAIGFYAPLSHRIIDCEDCMLQPVEFKDIINIFRDWIRKNKISIYNEVSGSGLLRHIYLRKAFATGEIMVCPVFTSKNISHLDTLKKEILNLPFNISSIIININEKKTNVVLGQECITIFGNDYITDILCGLKFQLSPLSFYQVNHDGAEFLYKKAAEYAELTGTETVFDIYCGTGTIGLTMAHKAKKLYGIEIIPEAIDNAKVNARINDITNSHFICADASAAAGQLLKKKIHPDVIILDPPRKGCDEKLINIVVTMNPSVIVYVSCDSATLARDCQRFGIHGYELTELTPVDMFPRTGNVECVCQLKRID